MWRVDRHGRHRAALGVIALALALQAARAASAPVPAQVTASLAPAEVRYGTGVAVSGRASGPAGALPGAPLALQLDAYPFRGFLAVAHTTAANDGSFTFADVRPDRNARLRVIVENAPAVSQTLAVIVDPAASSSAHSLGPGQVRLRLTLHHTHAGGSRPVRVFWFLAARASRVFRLLAVTYTRELARGVTYASAIVDPPSKRFVYRVCLNPPWEKAMGPTASHRTCPSDTFVLDSHAG